jgi:hypothetical protein
LQAEAAKAISQTISMQKGMKEETHNEQGMEGHF